MALKLATTKRNFFDAKKVIRAMERAERRELSRYGAFVMTGARRRVRRRKSSAGPGKSPTHWQTGSRDGLRRILFAYEPRTSSVIIGPVKLNAQGRDVPNLMETGGTGRPAPDKPKVRYRPHPFVGPEQEKRAPQFPDLLKGSVR